MTDNKSDTEADIQEVVQVKFMENLVQPERLRSRILLWVEEEVRAGAPISHQHGHRTVKNHGQNSYPL